MFDVIILCISLHFLSTGKNSMFLKATPCSTAMKLRYVNQILDFNDAIYETFFFFAMHGLYALKCLKRDMFQAIWGKNFIMPYSKLGMRFLKIYKT